MGHPCSLHTTTSPHIKCFSCPAIWNPRSISLNVRVCNDLVSSLQLTSFPILRMPGLTCTALHLVLRVIRASMRLRLSMPLSIDAFWKKLVASIRMIDNAFAFSFPQGQTRSNVSAKANLSVFARMTSATMLMLGSVHDVSPLCSFAIRAARADLCMNSLQGCR